MPKRKTPEDYYTLAESRGFEWLGAEPLNTKTKTTWKCSCGRQFEGTYENIRAGRIGCYVCSKNSMKAKVRLESDSYYEMAEKCDLEWLGPEVFTVMTKTYWRCKKCGYKRKTTYNELQHNKYGCPKCAIKHRSIQRQKPPKAYDNLARTRSFIWLGPEVSNVATNTWWKCVQGHKWAASYSNIYNGTGCPFCANNNFPKSIDDYYELAKDQGLEWLGPEVDSIKTKTLWRCKQGHKFLSRYNDIHQGHGCPHCNESQGEKAIARLLDRLNIPYERQYTFDQCRGNSGRPLFFDFAIFISGCLLLIEYDGEGHTKPIKTWGGKAALKATRKNDTIKNKFAKDHGIPLLRISYTDFDNIETIIIDWLDSLQDKPTRMDKPPKGVSKAYKSKNSWKIATQLSLLNT